jgi:hypothetical protein
MGEKSPILVTLGDSKKFCYPATWGSCGYNFFCFLEQNPILRLPSYNASVVEIYNATSSIVRFQNKQIFFSAIIE